MEHIYTAHKKLIDGTPTYFIKKILTFPATENIPDIQDGFGMHTNFDKACSIAGVEGELLKARLLQEADGIQEPTGLVVSLQAKGRSVKMIQ